MSGVVCGHAFVFLYLPDNNATTTTHPVPFNPQGPRPPSGYPDTIAPHGDQCVLGGGYASDWNYPCTNYYFPNASDARKVTDLQTKIEGDDSEFLVSLFADFLEQRVRDKRPFLAHMCLHGIHEPHPALPQYYDM
jgi:hypothetical protein